MLQNVSPITQFSKKILTDMPQQWCYFSCTNKSNILWKTTMLTINRKVILHSGLVVNSNRSISTVQLTPAPLAVF